MRLRTDRLVWKFKRFASNMNYRLGAFRIPSERAVRPSQTIATVSVIAFSIFILAGGIFDMLEKPLALLPKGRSGWTFLYPGNLHFQTSLESILAGFLYLIGLTGLYMLLRSTRLAYKPRNAYTSLILGLIVTVGAVFYASAILASKIGG